MNVTVGLIDSYEMYVMIAWCTAGVLVYIYIYTSDDWSDSHGNRFFRCEYITVRYTMVRYKTVRYKTVRYKTVHYKTVRYKTNVVTKRYTLQNGTLQNGTVTKR
jgi:hypothetical protein